MSIAALVLAAGSSNRLGAPKQLVDFDGKPLVRHVVEIATRSACDAVAVVLGANADRITGALHDLDVVELTNARWIEGMASSIRAGVAWADTQGFDAVVLLVADQHRVDTAHLDALTRLHRRGHAMVASRYCGVLGVPALFARQHYGALMSLAGDRGARDVLRSAPAVAVVEWEDGALDLDTPRDLARLKKSRARVASSRS